MTKLQEYREQFTESNAALRVAREQFFMHRGTALVTRLSGSNPSVLREVVVDLKKQGLYSSKCGHRAVEYMLLKQLRHRFMPTVGWTQFINKTVGPRWFNG